MFAQLRTGLKAELRRCVKVEVAVLGSSSLTVRTVSVDVKRHWTVDVKSDLRSCVNVEVAVLGRHSSPYGLCGRKAILYRSCVNVGVAVLGRQSSPYGLCGRKARFEEVSYFSERLFTDGSNQISWWDAAAAVTSPNDCKSCTHRLASDRSIFTAEIRAGFFSFGSAARVPVTDVGPEFVRFPVVSLGYT